MRLFIRISENSARLAILCLAGLALGAATAAQARIETLRWSHDAPPEASGFRVYVGSASGTYPQVVNAGLPALNADGTCSFDLQVADQATVYVAVSAYNSAGESALSNEQMRAPVVIPTPPPTPLPPPPPVDPGEGDVVFNADFQSSAIGQYVPGWIDTQAWFSMVEDDSLFSVTALSGNRVFTTSSTQPGIHSHYVGSDSADWFLYELRGRMRASSSAGRLGVTAYSQYTSEDFYYGLGSHWQTGELELHRHLSSSSDGTFICGSSGTGVMLHANVWYKFRFQVIPEDGANSVRAKVWEEGNAEPVEWQAACTDVASNRPTSGTIGFWSGSTGAKYWDDLEVIALPGGMVPGGPGEPLGPPGQPQIILP